MIILPILQCLAVDLAAVVRMRLDYDHDQLVSHAIPRGDSPRTCAINPLSKQHYLGNKEEELIPNLLLLCKIFDHAACSSGILELLREILIYQIQTKFTKPKKNTKRPETTPELLVCNLQTQVQDLSLHFFLYLRSSLLRSLPIRLIIIIIIIIIVVIQNILMINIILNMIITTIKYPLQILHQMFY